MTNKFGFGALMACDWSLDHKKYAFLSSIDQYILKVLIRQENRQKIIFWTSQNQYIILTSFIGSKKQRSKSLIERRKCGKPMLLCHLVPDLGQAETISYNWNMFLLSISEFTIETRTRQQLHYICLHFQTHAIFGVSIKRCTPCVLYALSFKSFSAIVWSNVSDILSSLEILCILIEPSLVEYVLLPSWSQPLLL
jgi:hypothetical protein